jgi:hypothetical protein
VKEKMTMLVPTTDGDVQAAVRNKSDDVFCDEDVTEGTARESYGDDPYVWLREMENIIAVDEMEHRHPHREQ